MLRIKELSFKEFHEVKDEAERLIEMLQNHYIAKAINGDKDPLTKAYELMLRSFKVGLQQGCNQANLGYITDKVDLAKVILK